MASCNSDQKRMLTAHFEQRAVIKFCANSDMTPTETWKYFNESSRGQKLFYDDGFDWHIQFREDRMGISDDFRREKSCIPDSAQNVYTQFR